MFVLIYVSNLVAEPDLEFRGIFKDTFSASQAVNIQDDEWKPLANEAFDVAFCELAMDVPEIALYCNKYLGNTRIGIFYILGTRN